MLFTGSINRYQKIVIHCDTSWDLIESNKGYLPIDEDAFEKIYLEWKTRNWPLWLKEHLISPFTVELMEDDDDAYFTDIAKHQPFRLGRIMKVIDVEPEEDDLYGVIVQVREGRNKGYVPLAFSVYFPIHSVHPRFQFKISDLKSPNISCCQQIFP
jgi:hypothetical protein